MTPYQNIYDRFERLMTDFDLDGIVLANKLEIEEGILMNAIPNYTNCSLDLSDRDDTLKQFNLTLSETDELVLAYYMKWEWLKPYLNTQDLLEVSFSTQEYNAFSDSAKIQAIRQLAKDARKEAGYLSTKNSVKSTFGRLR
jgi:hypothetical protein